MSVYCFDFCFSVLIFSFSVSIYFACFKEGLCVACYIASKKQKACVLVLVLALCFKEAEGLHSVCYNFLLDILFCVRSRRLVLFVLIVYLIFAFCFKEADGLCCLVFLA